MILASIWTAKHFLSTSCPKGLTDEFSQIISQFNRTLFLETDPSHMIENEIQNDIKQKRKHTRSNF